MQRLTTALVLLTLAVPSHAAPLRRCRTAAAARSHHVGSAATTRAANHHAAQSNVVVTAFAVPVAVPIAPFAPYWYGVTDYIDEPLIPKLRLGTYTGEAPLRDSRRQTEPTQRENSLVSLKCTVCHGATSPKQGLSLVDPLSLSAEDRLRAIRAVVQGIMPPDTEPPLRDTDRAAILQELTAD